MVHRPQANGVPIAGSIAGLPLSAIWKTHAKGVWASGQDLHALNRTGSGSTMQLLHWNCRIGENFPAKPEFSSDIRSKNRMIFP
jgi:hypothetical protein